MKKSKKSDLYYIYFYVPTYALKRVKAVIFAAGAGRVGSYSNCAWQTLGVGEFLPGADSHPAIGKKNRLTRVKEYKVETIVSEKDLPKVLAALKKSHSYETPAYGVFKIENAIL